MSATDHSQLLELALDKFREVGAGGAADRGIDRLAGVRHAAEPRLALIEMLWALEAFVAVHDQTTPPVAAWSRESTLLDFDRYSKLAKSRILLRLLISELDSELRPGGAAQAGMHEGPARAAACPADTGLLRA